MRRFLANLALILIVAGLVYLILSAAGHATTAPASRKAIETARAYYAEHQLLTVVLFCAAHIVAATLCIPGGCTVLNITSGALFGFWQGCALIYVLTMISAALGYLIGTKFGSSAWLKKFRPQAQGLLLKAKEHDYFYFVSLRLSPLLPFGILNVMMGAMGVPFGLFCLTTFAGIFFDVVLLNNIGAAAFSGSWIFAVSFAVLFLALFLIRKVIPNRMFAPS